MKHYLISLIAVGWLAILLIGGMPLEISQAQTDPVVIRPDNAAQVVELARFGRGMVEGAIWSPNASQLLVYGSAGVWLYSPTDLTTPPTLLTDFNNEVKSAVYNVDGTLIVSASDKGTVRVWDLAADQETMSLRLEGNFSTSRAAISPDGKYIIMSVGDNLLLHDATTGELLVELKDAHSNIITGLAYSPDGTQIVSCSSDKTARVWNANTLEQIAVMQGHTSYVNEVAFSPDGSHVVTVSSDKSVRQWNPATGTEVALLEAERGNMLSAAYRPNGNMIAVGNSYGEISFLDATTLAVQTAWEDAHASDVYCVAFSPDGTLLVSTSDDQSIKIWDVASGAMLEEAPGHTREVGNIAFSPDGTRILSGTYDGTLRVWDIAGDDAHPAFVQERGVSTSTVNLDVAEFSPDGMYFAGISGSTLSLWETSSNEPLYEVGDYDLGSFRSMAFSPDGLLLAVTTNNATVLLWDTQTGDLLQTLNGHSIRATPVVFNTDGSLLISGGADGTVRVWGLPETASALGLRTEAETNIVADNDTANETATTDEVQSIQSSPGNFVAEDGFTFSYPSTWILPEEKPGSVWIATNQSALDKNVFDFTAGQDAKANVLWGPFETMVRYADLDPATATASEIADALFPIYYPIVREKQGPIEIPTGKTTVAQIDGFDNTVHRLLFAFTLEDGTVVVVHATFLEDDLAQVGPMILDIVNSIVGVAPSQTTATDTTSPVVEKPSAKLTGPENCNNVAVTIADYSSEFGGAGYSPANLLDGDPTLGWSSAGGTDTEYVVINLTGTQSIIGVLLNGYSPSSGYEADSIKEFSLEVPDGNTGTAIFSGQVDLLPGYQVFAFSPVKTDQLRFVFTSTHGGAHFEAADIMVCAAPYNPVTISGDTVIRQWASRAEATSQYSDTGWNAAQATGAPNTRMCGDIETAWASLEATGVDDLTVHFDTPVMPQQVNIYQTYGPGSITGITLIAENGAEFIVPDSVDTGTSCPGIFSVDIPLSLTQDIPVNGVRIHLDQRELSNWNEIDAVELVGSS